MRSFAPQKPLRATCAAWQCGELDPLRGASRRRRERSRGIETATELVIGAPQRIGSVRVLTRQVGSLGSSSMFESMHRRGGQSKRERSSFVAREFFGIVSHR